MELRCADAHLRSSRGLPARPAPQDHSLGRSTRTHAAPSSVSRVGSNGRSQSLTELSAYLAS